ncbi:hypothetical protein Tco_0816646, partial [Tanacetum coccineum]
MDGDFGVECFPSGRGYRGRVRWKWVRGELESVLERWYCKKTVGKGWYGFGAKGIVQGWVAGFKRE